MIPLARISLFARAAFLAVVLVSIPAFALERTVGTNATLETQAGTRSAALGGASLAIPADLPALTTNPQQLAGLEHSELAFAHVAYYEGTEYDYAAMGWPLGSAGALGLGVSRFGASGIPLIRESDPLPEGNNYQTFNLSDWVITGAWGRAFGKLSTGLSVHGLKRELDQTGWGFRADAGIRYAILPQLAFSTLLQGWTSSAAHWESGQNEYSPPEIKVALHGSEPFPYFYGKGHLYWQSAGLLHRENRNLEWDGDLFDTTLAATANGGGTAWQDLLDWLAGGSLGLEFITDYGISLRAGLLQIQNPAAWTAGAGIQPFPWLQADYAYQHHPVLSATHRVALSFYPGLFLNPEKSSAPPQTTSNLPDPPSTDTQEIPVQTETPAQPATATPPPEDTGTYWEE